MPSLQRGVVKGGRPLITKLNLPIVKQKEETLTTEAQTQELEFRSWSSNSGVQILVQYDIDEHHIGRYSTATDEIVTMSIK